MPLLSRSYSVRPPHSRRRALRLLAASLIALAAPLLRADTIPTVSASLRIEEGDVFRICDY